MTDILERRDPYGAHQMTAVQVLLLRARLVAEALRQGRCCSVCLDPPTQIVLCFEVELLLCDAHAKKALGMHDLQVGFYESAPDPRRIIRWYPEREGVFEARRQQHQH